MKFPLRDEPSNLDSARATMKERSARAGDSIEGGLAIIRNFKEVVIGAPTSNLI